MAFPRQPQPTIITVTGGDDIDRNEMAALLQRFLNARIDIVERSHRADSEIIRCYPRAVNE